MERDPRHEKVAIVDELKQRFESSTAVVLTEYRGLSVAELESLRRRLRESGSEYKIFKNTFVRFAANDRGLSELVPLLEGPTGLAFVSGDAVEVAKAIKDFARENPELIVKGGVLGEAIISAKDIISLADLPSREVLLAKIAGGLAAPMQKFAGLLQALPQNFAYALSALIAKGGAAGAGVEAAAQESSTEAVVEDGVNEAETAEEAAPEVAEAEAE